MILVTVLALGVLLAAGAAAEVIEVALDGTGDTDSIAAAVAMAADGDIIRVAAGTYVTQAVITTSLTIEGSSASSVVLDGQGGQILLVEGSHDVHLQQLTFTGGSAERGGAIQGRLGAQLTVEDCVFEGNEASHSGGAIHVASPTAHLDLRSSRLEDNFAEINAGGVFVTDDASCDITSCQFLRNRAMADDAVVAYYAGDVRIDDSVFTGTHWGEYGPISYGGHHEFTITHCTIWDNYATAGAAVSVGGASRFELRCTIIGQSYLGYGVEVASNVDEFIHWGNLYYDNDWGDLEGAEPHWSEILYVDPQLCDPGDDDFSPCAESVVFTGFCDVIGAFLDPTCPCGGVRTEKHAWSEIKAQFH